MMSIQTVGRYEITGELGRGAMGVVYKALDPTIGRTVALKTMRLDVHGLDAQEMVRRFQNEARAAGVLNHPNIVTIYDAGEQDGIFYIAMEFIEGTTLHELLAEKRVLATEEVLQLTRQICRGLDVTVHPGLSAIVTKALAKAPDDRYQTGADLVRDLENYKLAGPVRSGSTAAISSPAPGPEKTLVLPVRVVSGYTVRGGAAAAVAPALAKKPIPVRRPTTAILSSKRSVLLATIVTILVLGSAMGGYAYHPTQVKMHQLAKQAKAKEAAAREPIAIAIPAPTPENKEVIASDTTVKFFPTKKSANAQKLPTPVKATSSP